MNSDAATIIAALDLAPHPEGGWYRETFRAGAVTGSRSAMTVIHFLLDAGQVSRWHRVDADEVWCWHAGDAIDIGIAPGGGGQSTWQRLGGDIPGESVHAVVPAGDWQAARATAGWGLVSCIVAPGFDFAGFELAPAGWSPA